MTSPASIWISHSQIRVPLFRSVASPGLGFRVSRPPAAQFFLAAIRAPPRRVGFADAQPVRVSWLPGATRHATGLRDLIIPIFGASEHFY